MKRYIHTYIYIYIYSIYIYVSVAFYCWGHAGKHVGLSARFKRAMCTMAKQNNIERYESNPKDVDYLIEVVLFHVKFKFFINFL